MSPFSAHISLKRSLVKDKLGISRRPPASNTPPAPDDLKKNSLESIVAKLSAKNLQLEKDLENMKCNYAQTIDDCHEAYKKIETLENVSIKEEDDKMVIEGLQHELKETVVENTKLKEIMNRQKGEICSLEERLKIKDEISNKLNKQLHELRNKHEKDIALIQKTHKTEVKSWRKDLGEERREKIKLSEKLEKVCNKNTEFKTTTLEPLLPQLEIDCKTFVNGNETCVESSLLKDQTDCSHDKQCVLRQPYPPPSPLSPYIVHDVSKYHIHMMTKTSEDLTGCLKCFSVDNENYGCDKCTWLKWWFKWHGDRHGLPDIHPSKYRKYL